MRTFPASPTAGPAASSCFFGNVPAPTSSQHAWELPPKVHQHLPVHPSRKCVKNLSQPPASHAPRSFLFLQKIHIFPKTSNTGALSHNNFICHLLIRNQNPLEWLPASLGSWEMFGAQALLSSVVLRGSNYPPRSW